MKRYLVLLVCIIQLGCAAGVGTGTLAGMMVAPERRHTTTVLKDHTAHWQTQLALARAEQIRRQCNVSVLTFDRHIILIGQAPTQALKQQAEHIARTVGVRQVINEIRVAPKVSSQQRLRDAWVTTQLKWRYYTHRDIGPNRVSVTTEDGTVYLLGILTSGEEATTLDIARHQPGVTHIVNLTRRLRV